MTNVVNVRKGITIVLLNKSICYTFTWYMYLAIHLKGLSTGSGFTLFSKEDIYPGSAGQEWNWPFLVSLKFLWLTGLEISENMHLPCITKIIGMYGEKINFQ